MSSELLILFYLPTSITISPGGLFKSIAENLLEWALMNIPQVLVYRCHCLIFRPCSFLRPRAIKYRVYLLHLYLALPSLNLPTVSSFLLQFPQPFLLPTFLPSYLSTFLPSYLPTFPPSQVLPHLPFKPEGESFLLLLPIFPKQ